MQDGPLYYSSSMGSMYGIVTYIAYIWLVFMVYVGKYTIHGSFEYSYT